MTTLTLDPVPPSLTASLRRLAPTGDPELQELLGNLVEAVHLLAAQGKPPPTMTPAKPSATSEAAPAVTPHGPANGVGAPPPTEDIDWDVRRLAPETVTALKVHARPERPRQAPSHAAIRLRRAGGG